MAAEPPLPTPHHHRPVTLTESGPKAPYCSFTRCRTAKPKAVGLRVLAQLYAPRYFQRLRVDRNVGYVVQCAFHRCADTEGMLFALQSPTFNVEPLRQLTDEFLLQMRHELAHIGAGELAQIQQALRQPAAPQHRIVAARPRNCLGRSRAIADAAPVTLTQLLHWQQRLFQGDDI